MRADVTVRHVTGSSLNCLLEFTGNDRLTFTDLTPGLLKRYEQQLLTQGCKITAVQFATVTGLTQSVQFPGKFIRGSSNWSGGGDATLYLWECSINRCQNSVLTRALQAGVYRLLRCQVHLLQQITHLGGTGVILFHLLRLLIRKTKITEVLIQYL